MNASAQFTSMAANLFHPAFTYAFRSMETLPIHPAFLPPAALTAPTASLQNSPYSTKGRAFTIDAILGNSNGNRSDEDSDDGCSSARRHRRFETTHPYLSALANQMRFGASQAALESLHSHSNRDKADKRCGKADWKPTKSKRVRTIFTPEQLERLEAEFERQQYMVGTERFYLASNLNLTEAQVKVWFQNRRIKWRKQNLEQQHAKLAKLNLLRPTDYEAEDSDSDNELAEINEQARSFSSSNIYQSTPISTEDGLTIKEIRETTLGQNNLIPDSQCQDVISSHNVQTGSNTA